MNYANEAPAQERRHGGHFPRMTGYRLLTIALTAGFGLSKAKLSYEGYSTSPNTLDWLYGVVAFLTWACMVLSRRDPRIEVRLGFYRLYWLGIYEKHAMHAMPWMFDVDYLALLWRFLTKGTNSSAARSARIMRAD